MGPSDSNRGRVRRQREETRELGFQEDKTERQMPPAAISEWSQETVSHVP